MSLTGQSDQVKKERVHECCEVWSEENHTEDHGQHGFHALRPLKQLSTIKNHITHTRVLLFNESYGFCGDSLAKSSKKRDSNVLPHQSTNKN